MGTWKVDKIDFQNDPTLNRIRQNFLRGQWPTECSSCKNTEESGNVSRRQSIESWYQDNNVTDTNVDLIRIDYWTGNTCNLRCGICGPRASSAWQKELGISKQDIDYIINTNWKNLDLSKLRWIHFNGGEPLLIDHTEFLSAIPNKELVHLNYNTNATVRPSKQLIELWSQFKLVQLDFSIDGIEDRFEYMRYPANWNVVKENLFWYREAMPVNFMFDINATISVLNYLTIDSTEKWFKENFNANRLGDPVALRKQYAFGVLSLTAPKRSALDHLRSMDKRRNTSWENTFPELVNYFNGV